MNTNVSGPIEGVLSRSEMKKVKAGSSGSNIYCSSSNTDIQHECDDDLITCLDACVAAFGDGCEGCAEMPAIYFA